MSRKNTERAKQLQIPKFYDRSKSLYTRDHNKYKEIETASRNENCRKYLKDCYIPFTRWYLNHKGKKWIEGMNGKLFKITLTK